MGDLQRAHPAAQPLGDRAPGLGRGLGEDHGELLTAVARHQVRAARSGLLQGLGHGDEREVTGLVALVVVVGLEGVDVGQHQGQRTAGAARALPLPRQGVVEAASIGHPGQAIAGGEPRQPLVGLLQRRLEPQELGLACTASVHLDLEGAQGTQPRDQLNPADGLGDVVGGSGLEGVLQALVIGAGCDHHHGGVMKPPVALDPPASLDPVDAG